MIGNAAVVILRPSAGAVDRNGDPTPGTPLRIGPIDGACQAPRTSGDLRFAGRDGAITGLTVYLPAGTDITEDDAVEVDGRPYEIDGVPGVWSNPITGWNAGVEVPLRRADG